MRYAISRRRRSTLVALACAGAALAGCSTSQHAASATTQPTAERTPLALGAGDAVGDRIRANHVLVTGRDAWDRDRLLADDAVRLAELLRGPDHRDPSVAVPTRIASENVPID